MSYMTWDYRCRVCGHVEPQLTPRAEPEEVLVCLECGEDADRVPIGGNITKASYVDGTRRFDDVRTQRKLQREGKKALRTGDRETAKKIDRELTKTKKG